MSLNLPIVIMATVLLGGALVGTVQGTFIDEAENQNQRLQDKIGAFQRSITLSENPNAARRQMVATTYLVTLRSTHCSVLYRALTGQKAQEKESDVQLTNGHFQILKYGMSLEESSVRNLECVGSKSFLKASGIKNAKNWITNPGEKAANAVLTFTGLKDISAMESDQFNDQEGKFGNVRFNYPNTSSDYLVIDANEHLLKSDGLGISNVNPSNGMDGYGDYDPFWNGDGPIAYAPDPIIAKYATWDMTTDDYDLGRSTKKRPPYDGRCGYPIKPFRPAMINVPLIAEKPLFLESPKSIDKDHRALVNFKQGGNVPFSPDITAPTQTEFCSNDPNRVWNSEMYKNLIDYYNSAMGKEKKARRSYDFVICPGAQGRIQSNTGLPYNEGEAQNAENMGLEKKKYVGENTAYPFIEMTDDSFEECRDNLTERFDLNDPWEAIDPSDATKKYTVRYQVPGDHGSDRNSPCGPGEIQFIGTKGNKLKLVFDGSDACDFEIQKTSGTWVEEPASGYTWNSRNYQDVILTDEGNVQTLEVTFGGDSVSAKAHIEDFELDRIKVIGREEGSLNPDYFWMDIKQVKWNMTIAGIETSTKSFIEDFNTIHGAHDEYMNGEDAGWNGERYRVNSWKPDNEGLTGNPFQVEWSVPSGNLQSIRDKFSGIPCDEIRHFSNSPQSVTLNSKEYKVKCGLHSEDAFGKWYGRYSLHVKEAN